MREIRQSGSEGGEPQSNAACLPLSFVGCVCPDKNGLNVGQDRRNSVRSAK